MSCLSGIGACAHVVGPDLWESGELLTEDMAAYMLAPMSDNHETAAQYLQTNAASFLFLHFPFISKCKMKFKSVIYQHQK